MGMGEMTRRSRQSHVSRVDIHTLNWKRARGYDKYIIPLPGHDPKCKKSGCYGRGYVGYCPDFLTYQPCGRCRKGDVAETKIVLDSSSGDLRQALAPKIDAPQPV